MSSTINYPNSLDDAVSMPVTGAGDDTSTADHAGLHNKAFAGIKALELVTGFPGTADKTSSLYKLAGIPTNDQAASLTGTETLKNKTIFQPAFSGNVSGWVSGVSAGAWTYGSWDSANLTAVINVPFPASSTYSVGMRITFILNATPYYGIVTAVNNSGTITAFFPLGTSMTSGTITSPYYSTDKAPLGFPLDPILWTVTSSYFGNNNTQSSPTGNQWYNLGSETITIPIGSFRASYTFPLGLANATGVNAAARATLSTANNSESDYLFTVSTFMSSLNQEHIVTIFKERDVTLSTATQYYLNCQVNASGTVVTLENRNDISASTIKAVCNYL